MFVYKLKSFLRPMAQFVPKLHASQSCLATKCLKKSGEVVEQNVRDGDGAIAREQFEGYNEDDNISWKRNITELRCAAMIIFDMMC